MAKQKGVDPRWLYGPTRDDSPSEEAGKQLSSTLLMEETLAGINTDEEEKAAGDRLLQRVRALFPGVTELRFEVESKTRQYSSGLRKVYTFRAFGHIRDHNEH